MTTPLDTHLALIQLAHTEAHWTAKEHSDWDSLVRFLTTKSPPVNPAVSLDALRHSLYRAATEIAAATAALNNTTPPGNAHAAWPLPDTHSAHMGAPPQHFNRGTQGILPSPKKPKVDTLPTKLNKHVTLCTKELLADY